MAEASGATSAGDDALSPSPRRAAWLFPVLVFVAAVLPLWGLSRDFNDGVIGEFAYSTGLTEGLDFWLVLSNWFGHEALYLAAMWLGSTSGLPAWVFIKLWMTLTVGGMAFETFRLARLHGYKYPHALAASAVAASFPAFAVLYSSSVMHAGFAWLGLLSHRLLFWKKGWPQAAGLLLTVISFQLNANLVLLIMLGLVAMWLQGWQRRREFAATVVSAVLFYLMFGMLFPPVGEYAGYNRILLPTSAANIRKILESVALYGSWATLLVVPLAVGWATGRWPRARLAPQGLARSATATTAATAATPPAWQKPAIALVLTASAALPYILVGKGAPLFLPGPPQGSSVIWAMYASTGDFFHLTLDAFMVRQATTMAAPFALLTIALHEMLSAPLALRRARLAFFAGVAASIAIQLTLLYWAHLSKWKQAHWDRQIVLALKKIGPPPAGYVNISLAPVRSYQYPAGESNHLLWYAYGDVRWLGAVYYRDDGTWEKIIRRIRDDYAVKMGDAPPREWLQYLLMDSFPAPPYRCETTIALTVKPAPESLTALVRQTWSGDVSPATVDSIEKRCP
ncbi:MAG: hypothetical protein EOO28_02310 [Comamonadaceae bacterium]|nr:MAG: hypothetical protein EOO28_02310 [Comamonadaceae bacterium]